MQSFVVDTQVNGSRCVVDVQLHAADREDRVHGNPTCEIDCIWCVVLVQPTGGT